MCLWNSREMDNFDIVGRRGAQTGNEMKKQTASNGCNTNFEINSSNS